MKKTSIYISPSIQIAPYEIKFSTSRSGGNGGQHVNKTETKVTLHWNIPESTSITTAQKERLQTRLQNRLTKDGTLVLYCSQTRSQSQNYQIIIEMLQSLIVENLRTPKKRRPTKPSRSSIEKRITKKKQRSIVKKNRRNDWS